MPGSAGTYTPRCVANPITGSLPVQRLKTFRTRTFVLSAVFREKAKSAHGALRSGTRHAISARCAIISMMRHGENRTTGSDPERNSRTCRMITGVLSAHLIQRSANFSGRFSSRASHHLTFDTPNLISCFFCNNSRGVTDKAPLICRNGFGSHRCTRVSPNL